AWEASIDVVSAIIPISVIDRKSGIIASEWYQESEDSTKRIKVNILVRQNKDLNKTIRVSVFQQKRGSKDESWGGGVLHNPESVANSTFKAKKIHGVNAKKKLRQ
ncbi:MAG: DUF3576 domain-containing protein, partial [Flavobacteriaceae bacterium]|nr:DUF3576 domain-containing protein [Flavobacteriaceae bacterium]